MIERPHGITAAVTAAILCVVAYGAFRFRYAITHLSHAHHGVEDKTSPAHFVNATCRTAVVGPLLAGFPIQLNLTVTPSGPEPLKYWCGGPGDYPSAGMFSVTATDESGKTRTFRLHNGQYTEGSGVNRTVAPGQSIPAAFDPLPPGRYTLKVGGRSGGYLRDGVTITTWPAMAATPIRIKVKDSPSAVLTAEAALIRLAEKDPFARHVAETYGIAPIVGHWMDVLLDDDPKEELLLDLAARKDDPRHWAAWAALACRHNPTALAPLVQLATNPNPGRRNFAVSALAGLRDQPAARDALNTALQDPDEEVRGFARRALEMHDDGD